MDAEKHARLDSCKETIVNDLDRYPVIDQLRQSHIFCQNDEERIELEQTTSDKNRCLLKLLGESTNVAYDVFINTLAKSEGQKHIKAELENTDVSAELLESYKAPKDEDVIKHILEECEGATIKLHEVRRCLSELGSQQNKLFSLSGDGLPEAIKQIFPTMMVDTPSSNRRHKKQSMEDPGYMESTMDFICPKHDEMPLQTWLHLLPSLFAISEPSLEIVKLYFVRAVSRDFLQNGLSRKTSVESPEVDRTSGSSETTDEVIPSSPVSSLQGAEGHHTDHEELMLHSAEAEETFEGLSSMETWTSDQVGKWLSTTPIQVELQREIQQRFEDEEVDGRVLEHMELDETANILPNIKYGPRKKLIMHRDAQLNSPTWFPVVEQKSVSAQSKNITSEVLKQPVRMPKSANGKCDESSVTPYNFTQSSVSQVSQEPHAAQSLRKFDNRATIALKYKQHALFPQEKGRPGNLIEPVHRYIQVDLKTLGPKEGIWKFTRETLTFAAACMNDRTNGTIHFGVGNEDGHLGYIYGTCLHQKQWRFGEELVKTIKKTFPQDQQDTALACIRAPNFIEVVPTKEEEPKYVIEVDIAPYHSLCAEEAFFFKTPEYNRSTGVTTYGMSKLYRCIDGELKQIENEQLIAFMRSKAQLSTRRKECEDMGKHIHHNDPTLRQKLIHLLCKGQDHMNGDIYRILVINRPTEKLSKRKFEESFSFLKEIDWKVVFDFDDKCQIFDFLGEEDMIKVIPSLAVFDPRNNANKNNPDALHILQEDIKSSSRPTWIFGNGYCRMSDHHEVMSPILWKHNRMKGFKEVIRFLENEIPPGRALVTYAILSSDFEVMMETTDGFFTSFPQQCICVTDDEVISEQWSHIIVSRNLLDPEEINKYTCVGMPWNHVQETVMQIKEPRLTGMCQLATSTGAFCTLKKKLQNSMDDLQILSRNECDNTELKNESDKFEKFMYDVEERFYRGADVSWWNYWFQPPQVLRRDMHEKLYQSVFRALTSPLNDYNFVRKVSLIHQPGAGGTTMARHILWDFKALYRCALVTRTTENTSDHILQLWEYEDSKDPNPILLLLDNLDAEKVESLLRELEEKRKRLTRDRDEKLERCMCVMLLCTQETTRPAIYQQHIFLDQELSRKEQQWFKTKYKKLEENYKHGKTNDPRLMISFNILKENFNDDYIRKTVSDCIQRMDNDNEKLILKYVSLLNKFDLNQQPIPTSPFDSIMMSAEEKFHGQPRYGSHAFSHEWQNTLSPEIKILLNETSQTGMGTIHAFCIIHPVLSKTILDKLSGNQTLSDVVKELFNSSIVRSNHSAATRTLLRIIGDVLRKRKYKPDGLPDTKFSPLVKEICENESYLSASQVMEMGYTLTESAFVAQQVSRLFIVMQNWPKATEYAEISTDQAPNNSFFWDTRAQIWKEQFIQELQELSIQDRSVNPIDVVSVLKKAFKAIKFFKKEIMVNEENNDSSRETNLAGYLGVIDVVAKLIESLRYVNIFHNQQSILCKFLKTDKFQPSELKCWEDIEGENFIHRLKGLKTEAEGAITRLEDENTHLREEIFDERKRGRNSYLKQKVLELKEILNMYYGEDSDTLPVDLSPEEQCDFRRRRVWRLCGYTIGSILHQLNLSSGVRNLEKAQKLILENLRSAHPHAKDCQYIISISIALMRTNLSLTCAIDMDNMVRWSIKLYSQREMVSPGIPHLEPYLFYVMFNWPRKSTGKYGLPPNQITEAIIQWKKAYFDLYPRQKGEEKTKKDATMFFFGQGHGMNSIVNYTGLRAKEAQQSNNDFWHSDRVLHTFERFQGTLINDGCEVEIQVEYGGGNKGTISIETSYPIRKRNLWYKRVFFFIGFSWKCPKAFDVSEEDPTQDLTPPTEGCNEYNSSSDTEITKRHRHKLPQYRVEHQDVVKQLHELKTRDTLSREEVSRQEELEKRRQELIRQMYAPEEFTL